MTLIPAFLVALFLAAGSEVGGDLSGSGFASPVSSGVADSLNPGDPAPPFVMRDLMTDEAIFLRDYFGVKRSGAAKKSPHVVILSFWATWCEPCKVEIPLLTELAREMDGKAVKIFLINTQEYAGVTEEMVRAEYKKRGYSLQCLIDASGRVSRQYTVRGLPMIIVVDNQGTVRKVNRGFHENFHIDVRNTVNQLLQGSAR